MTPIIKSVELPHRVKLPYVEQGDPSGVPMILLHGYTDSWRSFEPVLPHLPQSIHAFALTQRGHGDADRPATGYRTRDFAADVGAFTDALGLGPAVVVGSSMGNTNAQRFAIDTRSASWVSCPLAHLQPTKATRWQSTSGNLAYPS
jgi:non-heme chloroperoxidase